MRTNCRCRSPEGSGVPGHLMYAFHFSLFLHFRNTLQIRSCFRKHFHKMIEKSPRPLTSGSSIGSDYPQISFRSAAATDLVYPSSSPTLFSGTLRLCRLLCPASSSPDSAPYLGSTGKRVPTVEGCLACGPINLSNEALVTFQISEGPRDTEN